jgi:hypothetical protein
MRIRWVLCGLFFLTFYLLSDNIFYNPVLFVAKQPGSVCSDCGQHKFRMGFEVGVRLGRFHFQCAGRYA